MPSVALDERLESRLRIENFSTGEAASLAAELKRELHGEVRFDDGSRALYATDASNYRQIPIGVVIPRDIDDVIATVALCRKYGAPILSRGGGTSLAGQCCNVAVIMDFTKYVNRLLELDADRRFARVEPGIVLDELRNTAERHHLTFGPDPATHSHCALGGMIGNNSCGVHSVMAGKTVDNVEELEVLLYDGTRLRVGKTSEDELQGIIRRGGRVGEIYGRLRDLRDRFADRIRQRYPKIPRRVSGYNLDELLPESGFHVARALVGSEGTLVTYLEATLRLVNSPQFRTLVVLGYADVYVAGDHVPEIMSHRPIGLEGLDDRLIGFMRNKHLHPDDIELLPEGRGWLLVEFGGESRQEADQRAHALVEAMRNKPARPSAKLFSDPHRQRKLWEVRESGLGATAFVPGEPVAWEGWEDAAVPPERVGDYLRDFRKLLDRHGYACTLYGHFGDGCIHTRIDFDLETRRGIEEYRRFTAEAADLVVEYGGSLSGEHGDGQSRGELLGKMFGEDLIAAFEEFKSIWDPQQKMNPGKVVNPYRRDENLRLGAGYHPPKVNTHFQFPEDDGSFARSTLRCVGVGECRRHERGTMCPSYMVTREEKHSTRGRAHLLFEMLQGEAIKDGWQSEAVKEALDLCLACKGCKGDCPVNVDLATYKAEFLSHYYQHKRRPRAAHTMGQIHRWARLASLAPRVANFLSHAPVLRAFAKWMGGVAPERSLPPFATQTFKQWFKDRERRNVGLPSVLLWPDTFTNYFQPHIGRAAVEVVEAAGFQVFLPRQNLCCGRPLYDYGMLDEAKARLREILDVLKPAIQAGVPVVGLEPSCTAVFRDELVNLFPHDEDAKRLRSQILLLSEFLQQKAGHFKLPPMKRKALVQGHCHHKAIMGMRDETALLEKLGLDFELLDSGCCGMAGSFGFERGEHFRVSVACGERVLLPAVRNAADDTLIIADGFSCQEQIRQCTGRKPMHVAEVIAETLHQADHRPSSVVISAQQRPSTLHDRKRLLAATGLGLVAVVAWNLYRNRNEVIP